MSRPSLLTYLVGNIASLVAVFCLMLWSIYAAFTGQVGWWIALAAIVVTSMSVNAGNRLTEYRNWKRDWDAMSGASPRQQLRIPAWRQMLGATILGVGAWGALKYGAQPGMEIPALLFWIGLALLLGRWVFMAAWRKRANAKAVAARDAPVTVVLPIPRQSPDAVAAIAALPWYCERLLK
ncbi:MAG: hypothetical protein EPN98_13985 [Phenylobacterium sp.]|uniref:hypothetical protein n=1 Tax=Phenylobacterium sp. TaxID=1871053 RepID=UPI0011F6A6BB|nr:hypothetical protein [Phenylobacterium sp.]TAL32256.1 MAG: hypothetical protein EPN98_13985 [Phenylobacterium sp.]